MAKRNSRLLLVALTICLGVLANAQYTQTNLVSDGFAPAAHIDPNLKNPWGLAFTATGPFWISDNGAGVSTLYNTSGTPFPVGNPLVVNLLPVGEAAPTGLVANTGPGFSITGNGLIRPAVFIFATEDGSIQGWNPQIDLHNVVMAKDNSSTGAVYKGEALLDNMLFVTNFNSGFVEAYDSSFTKVGQFTDEDVPAGYAPFGIEAVNGNLVVTFALQDADKHDDVAGPGHGFVDVFAADGTMIKRLASRGVLNSPWGIAVAPSGIGPASHKLLIGNFGDGRIDMFTMQGASLGPLRDTQRRPIAIDGLWSLKFGNGGLAGRTKTLFFTAGPNDESDGLFGSISKQ